MARTRGDGRPRKDIFRTLANEHRLVSALLEKMEEACEDEDFERAGELFEVMKLKLTAHPKGEEAVVYPRLAEQGDELEQTILEAREEHALVEAKLNEMSELDVSDREWKAKLKVLADLVEHHVEEEEGETFPAARKQLSREELAELAETFANAKRDQFGEEADQLTEIEIELMSKEQLLEKARELGVEGTGRMSKAQIADAVIHHS